MQYSIINYSHHAIRYIPRTYLFYNWKFVPFDLPLPISPTSPPSRPYHSYTHFTDRKTEAEV